MVDWHFACEKKWHFGPKSNLFECKRNAFELSHWKYSMCTVIWWGSIRVWPNARKSFIVAKNKSTWMATMVRLVVFLTLYVWQNAFIGSMFCVELFHFQLMSIRLLMHIKWKGCLCVIMLNVVSIDLDTLLCKNVIHISSFILSTTFRHLDKKRSKNLRIICGRINPNIWSEQVYFWLFCLIQGFFFIGKVEAGVWNKQKKWWRF